MTNRQENWRFALQVIMTLLIAVLTAINGWALHEISYLGKQVAANTIRIEDYHEYPSFTRYDAEKDFGVVTRLLEQQGKTLDDHEGRLRILERNP